MNVGLWLPDPIIPFKSDPSYCQFTMLEYLQNKEGITYFGLIGTPKLRTQSEEAITSGKLNWIHRNLKTKIYNNESLDVIMMYQSGWMYPEQKIEIDHFIQYLSTIDCKNIIWIDTDNDLQNYHSMTEDKRIEHATIYFIRTYLNKLLNDGYNVTFKVSYKEKESATLDYIPYCVSDYFPLAKVNPDPEFGLMFFGGIQLRSEYARESILRTIPNALGKSTYLIDKSWKDIVKDSDNARVGRTRFLDWTNNYGEYLSNALVSLDATRPSTTSPVSRTVEYYMGATPVITRSSMFEHPFKFNYAYSTQEELNSDQLIQWLKNVKDYDFRVNAVDEYREAVRKIIHVQHHAHKYFRLIDNSGEILNAYGSHSID